MSRVFKLLIFFILFLAPRGYCDNQRFISLSPAATEILFSLGLDKQIIGDTTYCNYPEAAKRLEKVGTFSEPNIERIVSLKPDIIFTTGLEQAPVVERLKSLGLKVVVSDPKSLSELFDSIKEIGRAAGRQKEADFLVSQMKKEIESVKLKVAKIPQEKRPDVFLEVWYDPIMTAGRGSIVDEILTLAGGKNIAYDTPRAYSRFSAETIIKRNPDVIILGYMSKEDIKNLVAKRMGWQAIKAVKNQRIISDIDPDILLRPSPRIVDGLKEIYKHLYNE
jgi:iron complex transport system substrate-binding protein